MVQYNVIANVINSSNLEESHVKIGSKKTTEEEYAINLLSNYEETTPRVEEVKKARIIKRGYLKKDETTTISIKEWMDYETTKEEGENKKFISKITIEGINGENTLGGKILANNEVKEKEPDFSVGFPNANTSEEESKKLSGIYKAEDDQGTSYFFRGDRNELNNNVEFAEKEWKILRINGDGTIRLILSEKIEIDSKFNNYTYDGSAQHEKVGFTMGNNTNCTQSHPCEVTYDSNSNSFNNENFGGTNSDIKTTLEKWYKSNLKDVNDKIAQGYFCNDTSSPNYMHNPNSTAVIKYGTYDRVYKIGAQPSLKCPEPLDNKGTIRSYGGIYKTKIGLITADEMNMAGFSWGSPYVVETNYLNHAYNWWSLSPSYSSDYAFVLEGNYEGISDDDYSPFSAYAVCQSSI